MTRQAVPNDQLVPFSNELVEQHLDAVFAYAFRLTCRSDWAEDLAQQAFLSACQHQQQLRNPDRVRQWLMSIVRNAYFNERRERRPVPASQLDVELLEVSQQNVLAIGLETKNGYNRPFSNYAKSIDWWC